MRLGELMYLYMNLFIFIGLFVFAVCKVIITKASSSELS